MPTLDPPVLDWGDGHRSADREARGRRPVRLALTVFAVALFTTLLVLVIAVGAIRG